MQVTALTPSAIVPTPAAIPPVADPAPAPQTPPVDPSGPAAPSEPTPEPRKLLQMLASGHFNPVADLRHREHFAQEIQAAGLSLPEPPAAAAHGKAYAKFLAAYRTASGPIDPPTNPVPPSDPTPPTDPATPASPSPEPIPAAGMDCHA